MQKQKEIPVFNVWLVSCTNKDAGTMKNRGSANPARSFLTDASVIYLENEAQRDKEYEKQGEYAWSQALKGKNRSDRKTRRTAGFGQLA